MYQTILFQQIRNDSLIEKLKQEDFKCYASENMLENEVSKEHFVFQFLEKNILIIIIVILV